jgi:hypothetical protein
MARYHILAKRIVQGSRDTPLRFTLLLLTRNTMNTTGYEPTLFESTLEVKGGNVTRIPFS